MASAVLTSPSEGVANDGHDNANSDLILFRGMELEDPDAQCAYEILEMLGQGTFGQVVKCARIGSLAGLSMGTPGAGYMGNGGEEGGIVAVKVIKNQPAYYHQALVEVSVLKLLNERYDPHDTHHIVRLIDHFVFRKHLCIVFELLTFNLFELIRQNQFRGLSLKLVRLFTKQLLDSLIVLREARVIHCDLKPENVLLKSATGDIKLIDFGSACMENRIVYSYIQSRFYRSPEVLLGHHYTSAIDMWSLGCVAAELFLGLPLFPGASEFDLLQRMVETLGAQPPDRILRSSKHTAKFFKHCPRPVMKRPPQPSKPLGLVVSGTGSNSTSTGNSNSTGHSHSSAGAVPGATAGNGSAQAASGSVAGAGALGSGSSTQALGKGPGAGAGGAGAGSGIGAISASLADYGRLKGSAGSGHLSPVSENAPENGEAHGVPGTAAEAAAPSAEGGRGGPGAPGDRDASGVPGVSGRGSGDAAGVAGAHQEALPAGREHVSSPGTEGPASTESRKGVGVAQGSDKEGASEDKGWGKQEGGEREGDASVSGQDVRPDSDIGTHRKQSSAAQNGAAVSSGASEGPANGSAREEASGEAPCLAPQESSAASVGATVTAGRSAVPSEGTVSSASSLETSFGTSSTCSTSSSPTSLFSSSSSRSASPSSSTEFILLTADEFTEKEKARPAIGKRYFREKNLGELILGYAGLGAGGAQGTSARFYGTEAENKQQQQQQQQQGEQQQHAQGPSGANPVASGPSASSSSGAPAAAPRGTKISGLTASINQAERVERLVFADFLRGLVEMDPEKRWTPYQAMQHPFISELPAPLPFIPPTAPPTPSEAPKGASAPGPSAMFPGAASLPGHFSPQLSSWPHRALLYAQEQEAHTQTPPGTSAGDPGSLPNPSAHGNPLYAPSQTQSTSYSHSRGHSDMQGHGHAQGQDQRQQQLQAQGQGQEQLGASQPPGRAALGISAAHLLPLQAQHSQPGPSSLPQPLNSPWYAVGRPFPHSQVLMPHQHQPQQQQSQHSPHQQQQHPQQYQQQHQQQYQQHPGQHQQPYSGQAFSPSSSAPLAVRHRSGQLVSMGSLGAEDVAGSPLVYHGGLPGVGSPVVYQVGSPMVYHAVGSAGAPVQLVAVQPGLAVLPRQQGLVPGQRYAAGSSMPMGAYSLDAPISSGPRLGFMAHSHHINNNSSNSSNSGSSTNNRLNSSTASSVPIRMSAHSNSTHSASINDSPSTVGGAEGVPLAYHSSDPCVAQKLSPNPVGVSMVGRNMGMSIPNGPRQHFQRQSPGPSSLGNDAGFLPGSLGSAHSGTPRAGLAATGQGQGRRQGPDQGLGRVAPAGGEATAHLQDGKADSAESTGPDAGPGAGAGAGVGVSQASSFAAVADTTSSPSSSSSSAVAGIPVPSRVQASALAHSLGSGGFTAPVGASGVPGVVQGGGVLAPHQHTLQAHFSGTQPAHQQAYSPGAQLVHHQAFSPGAPVVGHVQAQLAHSPGKSMVHPQQLVGSWQGGGVVSGAGVPVYIVQPRPVHRGFGEAQNPPPSSCAPVAQQPVYHGFAQGSPVFPQGYAHPQGSPVYHQGHTQGFQRGQGDPSQGQIQNQMQGHARGFHVPQGGRGYVHQGHLGHQGRGSVPPVHPQGMLAATGLGASGLRPGLQRQLRAGGSGNLNSLSGVAGSGGGVAGRVGGKGGGFWDAGAGAGVGAQLQGEGVAQHMRTAEPHLVHSLGAPQGTGAGNVGAELAGGSPGVDPRLNRRHTTGRAVLAEAGGGTSTDAVTAVESHMVVSGVPVGLAPQAQGVVRQGSAAGGTVFGDSERAGGEGWDPVHQRQADGGGITPAATPPEPGDWDPYFSDELLLQDEGSRQRKV